MKCKNWLVLFSMGSLLCMVTAVKAQTETVGETIFRLDSVFWQAYNQCDVEKMRTFFTDDLEFYHDLGGLTVTAESLMENTKKGICREEGFRLRREAVKGTVQVFPLHNYGAIISGEHVFYILEEGKPEQLDGRARFTHVWRYKDNEWKMHRILSYDHGPALAGKGSSGK